MSSQPRSHSKRPFGQSGEALAARYLAERGYQIVATNWHCQHGELDIVARQTDMLVFVEVRTRHANTPDTAFESITPRKRHKLTALAHAYLTAHNLDSAMWRVDVIAIAIGRSGPPQIEHAEDALGW
jgi:putative endonuclease